MIGIEISKEFKIIPSLIAEFKINYQGQNENTVRRIVSPTT